MSTIDIPATRTPDLLGEPLTHRERIVLGELGGGATLDDVARRLWVSRNTVKTQLRSVYRKIGATTRDEAVAWARAAGIL